ncbi:MAG TPA: hypothetical protein VGM63_05260 [Mucilaginibacter sp.]
MADQTKNGYSSSFPLAEERGDQRSVVGVSKLPIGIGITLVV